MSSLRIGYGEDIHRLQEGGRFVLAGTEITTAFSPVAHSDGDCYYHALADAILGAIGGEDIGHHFPPEEKKTAGMDSSLIVKKAIELAKEAGFAVVNLDSYILLERPKIGSFVITMKEHVASLLGISTSEVAIKAGTNEGLGPIGEGKAVKCVCTILLERNC